jgi:hypothetical protein
MLVPRFGPRALDPAPAPGSWPVRLPGAVGCPIGFGAAGVATVVAWLLGAGDEPVVGLVILAGTAGVVGAVTTVSGALTAAVQCWAFYTGFVRDRLGVLQFDGLAARDMALIGGVAVAASLIGLLLRVLQRHFRSAAPVWAGVDW